MSMEQPSLFVAVALGIVEGLTEFLPVSSTGHLIVAGSLLKYTGEQAKVFEIVIQAGAILAASWEFHAKLIAVLGGLFSHRPAQLLAVTRAIPTLFAACAYESVKNRHLLAATDLAAFGVGFAAAFVSAFLCVRWLLRYVSHNDFVPFAWYRIAFGALIVITAYAGLVDWS